MAAKAPGKRRSDQRQHSPGVLQDHSGLENRISTTLIDEFIAPLEVRVEQLEQLVAGAIGRGTVHAGEIAVPALHGGTVYLEPEEGFEEDTIGRPILINQGAAGDQDEGDILLLTAEVLDKRRMRVRFYSATRAKRSVPVVYLIG